VNRPPPPLNMLLSRHTRRREFIALVGGTAVAWPLAARAQHSSGLPLIGILSPQSAASAAPNVEAFRSGLRDLGYVEGRNIAIDLRYANGELGRMSELAAELAALKPAAIVAGSEPAILAVRNATHTIPIVMSATNQDPIALGLAATIARPGSNVTGFWLEGDAPLIWKRLELLKDAMPQISRVGIIVNPDDTIDTSAARSLPAAPGLTVRVFEVRALNDLEALLTSAVRESVEGLVFSNDPLFMTHRTDVAAMTARAGLPAAYGFREFAVAGGLMSYASNLPDIYRRSATLVDKILKGASPADLPIKRPTKYELVINLKAAKALGLNISRDFLLRADEVIE
jgi:putative tryptophan/tyrosine transport system substrate-binding protein